MRILYITRGDHVDYQNDCLLIGLKELFGSDVVDVNKQHHNYDSFPAEYANRMYGRGFTLTRVLPDLIVVANIVKHGGQIRLVQLLLFQQVNHKHLTCLLIL